MNKLFCTLMRSKYRFYICNSFLYSLFLISFLSENLSAQGQLQHSPAKNTLYCIPSSLNCINALREKYDEIHYSDSAEAVACINEWTFWMLCQGRCEMFTHNGPFGGDTRIGIDEKQRLKKVFPDYDRLPEYTLAHSTVGIVINSRLPINSLTTQQLGDVFSGKIKNWNLLGGPDQTISVIGQDGKYLSGQVLCKRCNIELASLYGANFVENKSFMGTVETVGKTAGAIGFFLHYTPGDNTLLKNIKRAKLLRIAYDDKDGSLRSKAVLPTLETIATGTYPLTDSLVLILHPKASSRSHNFAKFIQSEAGAEIARKYALFPEYDRQKYLSEKRLNAVKKGEGQEITVYGHRPGLGVFRLLSNEFVKAKSPVQLKYLVKSQVEATTAFLNREVDILLVDEPFSKKTLKRYASQLSKYHPEKFDLAQVGVGIIVHPLNKIDWLKQEELLKVFTSQTRYWSQIQREEVVNSSKSTTNIETQINKFGLSLRSKQNVSHPVIELFQETILNDKRTKNVKGLKTSEEVINSVSLDANSIGFINLADLDTTKTNVKLIGIVPEGKSFPETVRVPQSMESEKETSENSSNRPRKKPDFIRFAQWEVSASYPLLRTWSLYVDRRGKDIAWEFADFIEAKTKDQKWLFIKKPDELFGGPEQVTRSLRDHGLIRPTEEKLFVKKTKGPKPVFNLP